MVHATSSDPADRLSEHVRMMQILDEESVLSLDMQRSNSSKRLGVLLVERGLLSPRQVHEAISLPALRKDFTLDTAHVIEARAGGADAVLLIVRILDDETLLRLHTAATALGMSVLVEVHNEEELEQAQVQRMLRMGSVEQPFGRGKIAVVDSDFVEEVNETLTDSEAMQNSAGVFEISSRQEAFLKAMTGGMGANWSAPAAEPEAAGRGLRGHLDRRRFELGRRREDGLEVRTTGNRQAFHGVSPGRRSRARRTWSRPGSGPRPETRRPAGGCGRPAGQALPPRR